MTRAIPELVAAALLVISFGANATELTDCPRPSAPQDLPDGSSVGESEMVEAQRMVKGFVSEGQAFLECLKTVIQEVKENVEDAAESGEEATGEQADAVRRHRQLVELHNEMVGEMKRVAEKFNQALRDYNANSE